MANQSSITDRKSAAASAATSTGRDSGVSTAGIRFPFPQPPEFGEARELTADLWWIRLPTETNLGHVNVYAAVDSQGLTVIDTGYGTAASQAALSSALKHPALVDQPLWRVIATHYHPDHLGLAGWLVEQGAELWTSRVTWAYSRLLVQQTEPRASQEAVAFMQAAGVMGVELAAYRNRPPHRFARQVHSVPACFRPILPHETLKLAGRPWQVLYGNGHAPELVTLWNSEWAIVSDQLLPSVGASLVVPYTEPQSDVVGEWLHSLDEISRWVSNDVICLPGHQLPFQGAAVRCQQNRENIETLCHRLLEHLRTPQTAYACLSAVYRRDLTFDERLFFVTEVFGLLNHLKRNGKVIATAGPNGATVWKSNLSRGT